MATTFIDWSTHTPTYRSAGHPPPALLAPGGGVVFLDQGTDPPLGARPEHVSRPQANTAFREGATLVMRTGGLIERRTEDLDVGLARLADSLQGHGRDHPEVVADPPLGSPEHRPHHG